MLLSHACRPLPCHVVLMQLCESHVSDLRFREVAFIAQAAAAWARKRP